MQRKEYTLEQALEKFTEAYGKTTVEDICWVDHTDGGWWMHDCSGEAYEAKGKRPANVKLYN